jgi:hypothetical protein
VVGSEDVMRAKLAQSSQGNNMLSINIDMSCNPEENNDIRYIDPKLRAII